MERLRIPMLTVALTLFLFACALTAGHGHGGFLEDGVDPPGWLLVLFGWVEGLMSPPWFLAWLANPMGICAFVCLCRRASQGAVICSAAAAGLSLVPLALLSADSYPAVRWEPPVALVFHGGRLELRLGYFAWLASQMALFAGALLLRLGAAKSKQNESGQAEPDRGRH
jgi:hypothetical protein